MIRIAISFFLVSCFSSWLPAQSCEQIRAEMKLPKKVKTRGKPKVVKWEDVDKTLNELDRRLQGSACSLKFSQIFQQDNEEAYFPLTNSVVRIVPEESLRGLEVYTTEGFELGKYAGQVKFEKSGGLYARRSYSLYYFQYTDSQGNLQSVGSRLLLDSFVVRWAGLKDKAAVQLK